SFRSVRQDGRQDAEGAGEAPRA
ncbi:phage tail assembly protein, partial [Burkholderia gladioli]|nr:phage tail assembly protein [Burkholderia gladioli]